MRVRRKHVRVIAIYAVTSVLAFAMMFPILWTLLTSLKTQREAFRIPPSLWFSATLQNYARVLTNTDFVHHAVNSLVIVGLSSLIAVALGSLTAYALCRIEVPGGMAIAVFMLVTRFVPPISTIIPMFLITRAVGLYDSKWILILGYTAINIPYVVWMMWSFFKDLPIEIEESAMIDGCSRLQTLWLIVLPLSGPGLAATAVLATIFSWNEFLYALTLTSSKASTLPLFMSGYIGDLGIDWPNMTASGILVILPALVVSILIQRQLARGLTFGAVKG